MTVTLKKATRRHALTLGNVYRVIGIEADDYRISDDYGRLYLFPTRMFDVVNAARPRQCITTYGEDGEEYAYPAELGRPGFFEDVIDGRRSALTALYAYLERPRTRPSVA